MSTEIEWISSGGGPLLLLPASLLAQWEGAETSSAGRIIKADFRYGNPDAPATDYDRACDVKDYLGVLAVGAGMGLVLGAEPFATAWWPISERKSGFLVCQQYGEDDLEERLHEVLTAVPDDFGTILDFDFTVSSGLLCLFDSAYAGGDVGSRASYLEVHLVPGVYSLCSGFYRPDADTSLLLHRLTLIEA